MTAAIWVRSINLDRVEGLMKNMQENLNETPLKRLSTDWITLWVHDVGNNLALIFLIVTTSILVSK